VWKPLDRIVPKEIKFFVVPMLTMIVTVPVTLICIGPIANYVAGIIASILLWMNENLGFVSIGAMGALTSILIFSGTAGGLYAPVGIAFATLGFEGFVMPGMLAGNVAVGGAALAAMTLCKNDDNKAAALSAGLTAVFGITEPAIFGVLVKYRKPFIGAIAGGLVGGCFAGLVSLKEFAFASPGVASLIAFINPDGTMGNVIFAVVTIIIAFATAFIVTRIVGIQEEE
ncbi:MAG: PTS transporter subunit EIIC, partial [Erysipelotrichaceae bacterium]|nr:PTS transporter subunit EIIC [Erysipelotrichaceae bacterium]